MSLSTKALEIDDSSAEAHASLGGASQFLWDFKASEREYSRAIELRPNYSMAYHWRSTLSMYRKQWDEHLDFEERALQLDPHSRIIQLGVGTALALVGRVDEAIAQYENVIEVHPGFALAHLWKSAVHVWRGQYETAIDEAKTAVQVESRNPTCEAVLSWAYASAGKEEEARNILVELVSRTATEYLAPTWIGLGELALGREEEGFRWLEKGVEELDPILLLFSCLPWWENLRRGPRWNRIEEKLGLNTPRFDGA